MSVTSINSKKIFEILNPNNAIIKAGFGYSPNKKDMIKESDGIRYLAIESGIHYSKSYHLYEIGGSFVALEADDNHSFQKLQERRNEGGKIPYNEQLRQKENIMIPNVGTSLIIVGNFTLKDGSQRKFIICPTRKKQEGIWAGVISGYVNNYQSYKTSCSPIKFTLHNEGHEELLLWDKNEDAVKIDFGFKPWEIFEIKNFPKTIKANELSVSSLPWLKTMNVLFENGETYPCFLDTRCNNLQALGAYEVPIDLRKIELTNSETTFKNGKLYEQFFDGQGLDSKFVLLPFDNPFSEIVYKPDSTSELGIIEVKRPEIYAELFNTHLDRNGMAYTNGDWVK